MLILYIISQPQCLSELLTFCAISLLVDCIVPGCLRLHVGAPPLIDWMCRLNDQTGFYNDGTTASLKAAVKLFVARRNGHSITLV